MKKQQNSKTQSEAEAELAAQRAIDPNAGNDPNPPAVAADAQKRTRKNRPVVLERATPAMDEPADWRLVTNGAAPENFPTESAAWEWVEENEIEGRLRTVIVTDERTSIVETVKQVKWA